MKDSKNHRVKPFLKWAGGKSQLLESYRPFLPEGFKSYYEPFIGGGAMFFRLRPHKSVLADANDELIETYAVVKLHVEDLVASLRRHKNDRNYYYRLRAVDPARLTPVERASRFIYLNRTCFNGLYRVNKAGQFNVPFGAYVRPRICDETGLRMVSSALRNTKLKAGDFQEVLSSARAGDLVYLDPPYDPVSKTASFTSYFRLRFGNEEQARLASVFRQLDARGCLVMLSNSYTPLVRELYSGFNLVTFQARRAINCRGNGRGPVSEVLVRNYG